MKLSLIALVFLLSTVVGKHTSPDRTTRRSNVAKLNKGQSTGPARNLNKYQAPGKSSKRDGKTRQQKDLVLTTRTPYIKPSAATLDKSNGGKVGKSQQQLHPQRNNEKQKTQHQRKGSFQLTSSPKLKPSAEMSSKTNSSKDWKTQQQQNKPQNQNIPTANLKPRSTDKQSNKNIAQQSATAKPSSGKSNNADSNKLKQSENQEKSATQLTPTTSKPSTEKSGNSSRDKVGETPQPQTINSPLQQISYGSTIHPVYQGHLPAYVYEYRNSGSRFDNLLTGLALYNLGRNSQFHHYDTDRQYRGTPEEVCKLGISKQTGEYEETRIDCNLMSSFIWEDTTGTTQNKQQVKTTTEVKLTQTVKGTRNSNSSVTTVTVSSNTVEDALKVKGPSIAVTPAMTCYMIRTFRDTTALRKPVDCGLLQEYARSLLHRNTRNSAQCVTPLILLVLNFLLINLGVY